MSKVPQGNTPQDIRGREIGLGLTVCVHVLALLLFFRTGFKTVYPPPEERGILLEFESEQPKPIEVEAGVQPRAENASPQNDIRLVQRSEGQLQSDTPARGQESSPGPDGDVGQPEPPRPIDTRALFTSADNRADTLAPQTAREASDRLSAGHPSGNTRTGGTSGEPTAQLQGRSVVGALPEPEYAVKNKAGKVVVRILVDQYGKVTNAIPGMPGTTVQDKTLWEAARQAAYKAAFNISSSAPVVQEGTITYIFTLE